MDVWGAKFDGAFIVSFVLEAGVECLDYLANVAFYVETFPGGFGVVVFDDLLVVGVKTSLPIVVVLWKIVSNWSAVIAAARRGADDNWVTVN